MMRDTALMVITRSNWAAATMMPGRTVVAQFYGIHGFRNAALLELADRFMGTLPAAVIGMLGIQTEVNTVVMSAASQRHAIERRQISANSDDPEFVAGRIAEALANIRFLVAPRANTPQDFPIVGYSPMAKRLMMLPIKFRAGSGPNGQDQWWISTAIPYGKRTYRTDFRKGRITQLLDGPMPPDFIAPTP